MGAYDLFQQSYLSSKLTEISLRELLFLNSAPCDIWVFKDGEYKVHFNQGEDLFKPKIRELINDRVFLIYVAYDDLLRFQIAHQENLRKVTRALSVGDSVKNVKQQLSLLSINMSYLFRDPVNDRALELQYKSSENLSNFILDNDRHLPHIYKEFSNQSYHYTLSQPLLSSILLAGFLKFTRHFSDREIKMLFQSSYFKDIGMSLLPQETLNKKDLDDLEKRLVNDHTLHSISILEGRVPLNSSYLNIISNHHSFSQIMAIEEKRLKMVEGIETLLVVMLDVFVAMISKRPYREQITVYDALTKLRVMYSKEYPKEFKYFVMFIQKFFGRLK